MATGTLPFKGNSMALIFDAILHKAPDPSRLPPELQPVILKALEKDREVRCQTASELRADLKRLRRQIESGQQTVPVTPPHRSNWMFGAIAATALIAAVAGLWWSRSGSQPAARSEWTQLTNLDTATQPALSADGRMLTFVRGPGSLMTLGQIYIKMLPDGEPVQMTRDGMQKMSPAFSPDGSRIAYGVSDGRGFDTWVVPVLGGEPRPWLSNAEGLTWIDKRNVLFSEVKTGIHMAIVEAEESRAGERDVYVPPNPLGMAHRSYPSPDGQWALVVEMVRRPWVPCKLVPLSGSTPARPVDRRTLAAPLRHGHPMGSGCTSLPEPVALSIPGGSDSPTAVPEQLTFGPTEEEGIAIAPDGRSFVTSVGLAQRPVRIHDSSGDRQISLEGYAIQPKFTPDGKGLCYRIRKGSTTELWIAQLDSRRNESLLPGFPVADYDISLDGQQVLVQAPDREGKSRLWFAPLDRRSPPRQIPGVEGTRPIFGPLGEIIFRGWDGRAYYAYRVREDGTGLRKAIDQSFSIIEGLSPDGQWLVVGSLAQDATLAFPLAGGPPLPIFPGSVWLRWSTDRRLVFMSLGTRGHVITQGTTYSVPLPPGRMLPEIPAGGFRSEAEIARLPGVQVIDAFDAAPGPTPGVYAFSRETVQRNLYRVPLP